MTAAARADRRTARSGRPVITVALDPGVASWSLRRQLRQVARMLGTTPLDPVIAIAGPFRLEVGAGLATARAALGAAIPDAPWLAYDLDGYAARPSRTGGTVGLRVVPSPLLAEGAAAIDGALGSIAATDGSPEERFMVPAARLSDPRSFRAARERLGLARLPWYRRLLFRSGEPTPLPPPRRPFDAIRLLVRAGGRPVAGFDLAGRRWLPGAALDDRAIQAASLRAYRRARGQELAAPPPRTPGETWLLADLHLGHPDIALYCARPFLSADVAEMDRVLIENWRRTVHPSDQAFLLGDLCASSDPETYRAAVAQLPGRVACIRGNHDPALPGLAPSVPFEAGGHRFLAIHDPADAPPGFEGWVIHGHLHDADLRSFPFFNPEARRVNVSAETAGYRPVPLSLVRRLIGEGAGTVILRDGEPRPPPGRAGSPT